MAIANYKDIINNNCNLAPRQLATLSIANKNTSLLRDLLKRKLVLSDNGNEVGSFNYILKSHKFFVRAKALQSESFLPFLTKETTIPIRPQVFTDFDLKEGDILISKDANIGEAVILDRDLPNHMLSGALYRLPVQDEYRYYILACLKHCYFRNQLDLIVPTGSTIRHAKTLFLDCKIPFPNHRPFDTMRYVDILTQSIIYKEKEIRKRHQQILEEIERELLNNQRKNDFQYSLPKISDFYAKNRIDAGYYCEDYLYNQFIIENYKNGAKPIEKWGYNIKRGQNLQVSQIGRSIYSESYRKNFYVLIRPTNFSEYGTIEKFEYLGNPTDLSVLEPADIVFSGEGTVGKCVLFINPSDKWITNIHGIILNKIDHDMIESAFVSCFLRYLRYKGVFDYISIGGQGGSLVKKYWKDIVIPSFPEFRQKEIAKLYHNSEIGYQTKDCTLDNFLEFDNEYNQHAGIYELDQTAKILKERLNAAIDDIVNDKEVDITFD
jgi:type I restriction enzyme S subunit